MEEGRKVRRASAGECAFCHGTFGKTGMARHLQACPARRAALGAAEAEPGTKKARLFHLVVAGRGLPDYWMHLEMPADATLAALDQFLRRIWLECCDHLSAFAVGGRRFLSASARQYDELGGHSMNYPLGRVLSPGVSFFHDYDFGSTTELALKVISERVGAPQAKGVAVMARNFPPDLRCQACGKSATQVCTQCWHEGPGWLCDECAEGHPCGEEMLLPVVNSPRMGVCGYTGRGLLE